MNQLTIAALQYRALELSVVPVRADKRSMGGWREYQRRILTEPEILERFGWSSTKAIAIVCGGISGDIEVIDIDTKNDLSGSLFSDFTLKVETDTPGLMARTVIARTRSMGYHLWYRCPEVSRNLILARRTTTDAEQTADPGNMAVVLIETRGEGGYAIVEPTHGYRFVQGTLGAISTFAAAEREALLSAARTFNSFQPKRREPHVTVPNTSFLGIKPLDEFDQRADVVKLLEKHHWTYLCEDEERVYFRRPGKKEFKSSGDYHRGLNRFAVLSTSTVFEPGLGYRPSAVYAILECGSDFTLAAQRLSRGDGRQYWKPDA